MLSVDSKIMTIKSRLIAAKLLSLYLDMGKETSSPFAMNAYSCKATCLMEKMSPSRVRVKGQQFEHLS